jgi:Subtilase family
VNHKGYNSLAIGNHNDPVSTVSGGSVFRNPSSSHGDRELPELSANGTGVTAVKRTKSGTSFAAPTVAGITALLQNTDSTLKIWPEGCRAILLAGARRNVVGNTWWNDVSSGNGAIDGSGAANAYQSYAIAENRVHRNGIALRGWDVGTLSSRDFDSNRMSTFTYRIRTPIFAFGLRVKVALAWNSKVTTSGQTPLSSTLTLDFDLMVFDESNNLVGYSGSWDNSYEIAEFSAQRAKTYTIKIRRWSATDSTWFGIAWTVYNTLFLPDPIILCENQLLE